MSPPCLPAPASGLPYLSLPRRVQPWINLISGLQTSRKTMVPVFYSLGHLLKRVLSQRSFLTVTFFIRRRALPLSRGKNCPQLPPNMGRRLRHGAPAGLYLQSVSWYGGSRLCPRHYLLESVSEGHTKYRVPPPRDPLSRALGNAEYLPWGHGVLGIHGQQPSLCLDHVTWQVKHILSYLVWVSSQRQGLLGRQDPTES